MKTFVNYEVKWALTIKGLGFKNLKNHVTKCTHL